jgi:hypothetical protein
MRRIGLAVVPAVSLLVPFAAGAQTAGKIATIGFLWTSSPSLVSVSQDAFRQGLRELGYIEGQNVLIVDRYAEEKLDRLHSWDVCSRVHPHLSAEPVGQLHDGGRETSGQAGPRRDDRAR